LVAGYYAKYPGTITGLAEGAGKVKGLLYQSAFFNV
jgi:hypothetical protein